MTPKPDQRQLAKDIYLQTDKTQQEIADILDVNRRTVYLWIKHGKWEEMKLAVNQAPGIILQDIYNHIEEINSKIRQRDPGDRCPTMDEVERLRKLLKMTTEINRRHAGAYIQAFEELIIYIVKQDVEFGQELMKYADNYVKGSFGDQKFHTKKNRDENIRDVINNLAKNQAEELAENPDSATQPTPETAAETATQPAPPAYPKQDTNGIQCDTDRITTQDAETTTQPAATLSYTENDNENLPPQYPIENISENAITDNELPVIETQNSNPNSQLPQPNPCHPEPAEGPKQQTLESILSLPPALRPSPFRVGNTLWVNYKEDINDNDIKMSDAIRFYPDMDILAKQNRAAYEMRMKNEAKHNRPEGGTIR